MVIPDWNFEHVIPLVREVPPEQQHISGNRSPYEATMTQVVERFATTPERVQLLHDFMDYRHALYSAGVTEGFQWVNGSFVEHVEVTDRPNKEPRPYDIDIVTFYHRPDQPAPELDYLFSPSLTLDRYNIDAYCVVLGTEATTHFVESVAYWYGMWSTRRLDQVSKGFVKIDLDPEHDPQAREALHTVKI